MARNTINNSYDSDEHKIILEDLVENGEEKLADLSDEQLQQLKQQAIEAEDYDIAKMIKQEQAKRKARLQESEDLQELEYQTIREELWKENNEGIQTKKAQAKKEDMAKVNDLKAQYYDNQVAIEDGDRQTRREVAWKTVNAEDTLKTNNDQNESNVENILNEISKEELSIAADLVGCFFVFNNRYNEEFGWDVPIYDSKILSKNFKEFDENQLNEYLHDNNITSHIEFQKYILNLCKKYAGNLKNYGSQIVADSNDYKKAKECLSQLKDFILDNDELNHKFSILEEYVNGMYEALYKYENDIVF